MVCFLKYTCAEYEKLFAIVLMNEGDKYTAAYSIFTEDKKSVLYLCCHHIYPYNTKEDKNWTKLVLMSLGEFAT